MFNIELHMQTDTLEWLEPLAKHLGHVEIALDYANDPQPSSSREPHPAVVMIDEIDRERAIARKKNQLSDQAKRDQARLARERARKAAIRKEQQTLSPKVIDAVHCATCGAMKGKPCGTGTTNFGRTGHTHWERRNAAMALLKKAEQS